MMIGHICRHRPIGHPLVILTNQWWRGQSTNMALRIKSAPKLMLSHMIMQGGIWGPYRDLININTVRNKVKILIGQSACIDTFEQCINDGAPRYTNPFETAGLCLERNATTIWICTPEIAISCNIWIGKFMQSIWNCLFCSFFGMFAREVPVGFRQQCSLSMLPTVDSQSVTSGSPCHMVGLVSRQRLAPSLDDDFQSLDHEGTSNPWTSVSVESSLEPSGPESKTGDTEWCSPLR